MPTSEEMAAADVAGFILDRRDAVQALIGRHEDFLIVSGLAGTSRDVAALTDDGTHCYTMAGGIATGSGIKATRSITAEHEIAEGARLLREGNGTAFVLLRVKPTDPPAYKRNIDPSAWRNRFRAAPLGR